MASLTPVRIRGKRNASTELKWHAGKKRKGLQPGSATASEGSSNVRSTPSAGSASRRRREKRYPELSQLEQLPTEVLQSIFEYSANVDLPLASPRLASQLESRHLHHSLTSTILQPVLRRYVRDRYLFDRYVEASDRELRAAVRLMESKFFTWRFFQSWLHEEFESRHLLSHCLDALGVGMDELTLATQEEWTWRLLKPSPDLLPPLKLLHGPFTQDNIRFLHVLCCGFGELPEDVSQQFLYIATEGWKQAISEGAVDAVKAIGSLGLKPDTDLLRIAVIDSGCNKDVVRTLADQAKDMLVGPMEVDLMDVDFLDPPLWLWAENAQANGDEKGPWLKDLLKAGARWTGREHSDIKNASSGRYR